MNKYILSIDPSLKDTGFTLWEKEYCNGCDTKKIECNKNCWKPIWVINYSFKNFDNIDFYQKIVEPHLWQKIYDYLDIYIERGFHKNNRNTTEILDNLRGNIFGLFHELYIPKKHGIIPSEWQSWYLTKEAKKDIGEDKWNKELSLLFANSLIKENNWNININNNDNIADSLLIGWYVINND